MLPERWPTEIPAKLRESVPVTRRNLHGRVEIEAMLVRMERHLPGDPWRIRVRCGFSRRQAARLS
jgi:hypothetical protein